MQAPVSPYLQLNFHKVRRRLKLEEIVPCILLNRGVRKETRIILHLSIITAASGTVSTITAEPDCHLPPAIAT